MAKTSNETQSAAQIVKNAEKTHPNIVKVGDYGAPRSKMPTGVFPLDLALLGGLPTGKVITLYGMESSCKTSLALRTIGIAQKREPNKRAVFIDVENSFDPHWAKKLGVDTDSLIYVRPIAAEQAVDLCSAFCSADDVSVIVLDSIGALVTQTEADDSAEKLEVGRRGILVGKLYRKTVYEQNLHEVNDRIPPTLILINQIRYKIGVMYGDPETLPGGMPFKFGSHLTMRLYGKGEVDKKVSSNVDAFRKITCTIKKAKFQLAAKTVEFQMALMPHGKFSYGDCPDWNTVSAFAKNYGMLFKNDDGQWELNGVTSKTLAPIEEHFYGDIEFGQQIRQMVLEKVAEDPAYDGVG